MAEAGIYDFSIRRKYFSFLRYLFPRMDTGVTWLSAYDLLSAQRIKKIYKTLKDKNK